MTLKPNRRYFMSGLISLVSLRGRRYPTGRAPRMPPAALDDECLAMLCYLHTIFSLSTNTLQFSKKKLNIQKYIII